MCYQRIDFSSKNSNKFRIYLLSLLTVYFLSWLNYFFEMVTGHVLHSGYFIFAHTDPEKIQVLRRTFWKPLPPIRSPVDFRLWLRNLIRRNVRPKSITVMTNHMIRNKYWLNCKFSLTNVEYISFCPLLNDCLNLLTNRSMYWEIKQ